MKMNNNIYLFLIKIKMKINNNIYLLHIIIKKWKLIIIFVYIIIKNENY